MVELRVKCGLKHAMPSASDRLYQPGDKVLVWKEKQVDSRIGECLRPFDIVEATKCTGC